MSKDNISNFVKKYSVLLILIGMVVILSVATNSFLTARNLLNVIRQITLYAIIGFGVTFIIITGGIDLSSGATIAVASMCMGIMTVRMGLHWTLAAILTMFVGGGCGLINGSLVAFSGIPPFVATLGMMLSLKGVALLLSDKPISGFPNDFLFIGRGSFLGVPILVYVLVLVALISHYLLKHTRYGRYIYAIGGNREAARVSGINIKKNLVSAYAYAGMLSALAGILLTSRILTAGPTSGDGYEMNAIAGVVIGGTSLSGGMGTIMGTLIGALIIGVLNNGLDLLRVNAYTQQVLRGVVIIVAIILDQLRNKKL